MTPVLMLSTAATFTPATQSGISKAAAGLLPHLALEKVGADRRANKRCANQIHPSTEICQKLAHSGAATACGRRISTKIHGRAPEVQRPLHLDKFPPPSSIGNELQD